MRRFLKFFKITVFIFIASVILNFVSSSILPVDVFDLRFLKLAGIFYRHGENDELSDYIGKLASSSSRDGTGTSVNRMPGSGQMNMPTTRSQTQGKMTRAAAAAVTSSAKIRTAVQTGKNDSKIQDTKDNEYLITFSELMLMENISAADKLIVLSIAGKISKPDLDRLSDIVRDGITKDEMSEIETILERNLNRQDIEKLMQILAKNRSVFAGSN